MEQEQYRAEVKALLRSFVLKIEVKLGQNEYAVALKGAGQVISVFLHQKDGWIFSPNPASVFGRPIPQGSNILGYAQAANVQALPALGSSQLGRRGLRAEQFSSAKAQAARVSNKAVSGGVVAGVRKPASSRCCKVATDVRWKDGWRFVCGAALAERLGAGRCWARSAVLRDQVGESIAAMVEIAFPSSRLLT